MQEGATRRPSSNGCYLLISKKEQIIGLTPTCLRPRRRRHLLIHPMQLLLEEHDAYHVLFGIAKADWPAAAAAGHGDDKLRHCRVAAETRTQNPGIANFPMSQSISAAVLAGCRRPRRLCNCVQPIMAVPVMGRAFVGHCVHAGQRCRCRLVPLESAPNKSCFFLQASRQQQFNCER